jgi:hypothetical protein
VAVVVEVLAYLGKALTDRVVLPMEVGAAQEVLALLDQLGYQLMGVLVAHTVQGVEVGHLPYHQLVQVVEVGHPLKEPRVVQEVMVHFRPRR